MLKAQLRECCYSTMAALGFMFLLHPQAPEGELCLCHGKDPKEEFIYFTPLNLPY